jgi:dihydroorotase
MSAKIHIANAFIVNEGSICRGDVIIAGELISEVSLHTPLQTPEDAEYIDADGLYLMPGLIDDQVHFREPGLTHKADIYHESRAAVAGGVTSYMDMPNTKPPATTRELLEEKYLLAAKSSVANYSFYMGVTNDNADEVLGIPLDSVCGLKMFLGSSTGNLLVNNTEAIEKIFAETKHIVAVHCEDDQIIQNNLEHYKAQLGEHIPVTLHHKIRDAKACMSSSSRAVALARKHKTRLHVLHISTADELSLFDATIPLREKQIISEVCVHHLWFTADDYERHGNFIKWNPSIKEPHHREGLRKALTTGAIDMVATDHAPHLAEEKNNSYSHSPSGAPIIQFSLQIMIELFRQKVIQLEDITRLMCHNPAILFSIRKRGFIRPGYFADLVLVDLNTSYKVEGDRILSKCRWSPLEGTVFSSAINTTFINGKIAWQNGVFDDSVRGKRLMFDRS